MKRNELQKMSEEKLKAIKCLHENAFYNDVVSNSGLVIEFALKSAICKNINKEVYPDNIKKYRSHDLRKLIELAKLETELELEKNTDLNFFINWSLLSKWSINFRYKPPCSNDKENAESYIKAIESPKGGVYPWIKKNW